MITKLRPLTIADWDAMPSDDGFRYEIIEGELFVSCSPGLTHERVAINLILLIGTFLETSPIGVIVGNTGVILSNFTGVIPDLVVFLNEQRDAIITNDRLTGPPALVIEILSPGAANISRDRVSKLKLYTKHGIREYWIVDPKNKTIDRFVRKGSSLVLQATLQDEDVLTTTLLPGFSCPANSVFKHI